MNVSSIVENVSLQQLRYFLAVAEGGTYSLGDRVRRSQPTVSRGIRTLERILGRPLFHAHDRTRLTQFGHDLIPEVRAVIGGVEALSRKATDTQAGEEVRGPLLIGSKLSLVDSELPFILNRLRERYPRLEIRVRSKDGPGLQALLAKGEVELIFSHERASGPNLEFLPLSQRKRVIVAPKGHPILKLKKLTAAALAAYPVILPERDSRTARMVVDRLGSHAPGGQLRVPIEVMGAEARSRYAAKGWGIAIAEEGHDAASTPGVEARPLPESVLPARTVGVYYRQGRYLSSAAVAFLKECRKVIRK